MDRCCSAPPALLSRLLDTLSAGLRRLPEVKLYHLS
jgi:hypothetical protein